MICISEVVLHESDGWGALGYVVVLPGGTQSGYIQTRDEAIAIARREWPLAEDDLSCSEQSNKTELVDACENALGILRHTHDRLIEYPEFETLRCSINKEARALRIAIAKATESAAVTTGKGAAAGDSERATS